MQPSNSPRTDEAEVEHAHNPLGDWLQAMSSQGSLESEGRFSMAQEKAWEKLGAFQLPFEGAWVLKLVQAAVAGRALRVAVTQTRSETLIRIPELNHIVWEDVSQLLFEVGTNADPASGHLAVGLRALAKSAGNAFFVNFPNDSMVVYDGEGFQVAESVDSQFEIKVSHFLTSGVFKAIRFMTGVQKALTDYCHLCPIPLTLDSRRLNSVTHDPFCRPPSECVPLAFLTAPTTPETPSIRLPSTDWEQFLPSGVRPALPADSPYEESSVPCGAAMLICGFRSVLVGEGSYYRTYPKPSELVWLCDGVIVARESLGINRSVAALVIVNAESLETDLTGFELRKNKEKRRRRQAAVNDVCCKLQSLCSKDGLELRGRSNLKSLLGWGGIALAVFAPPAGLALLGMRAFSMRQEQRKVAKEFQQSLSVLEHGLLQAGRRMSG